MEFVSEWARLVWWTDRRAFLQEQRLLHRPDQSIRAVWRTL